MTENTLTLVVGGTGKTGRRVAERLRRRGLPVRAVSRATEPSFDWGAPGTWAPALRGVTSAYLTYYPDLAFPGAPETIEAFARLAAGSGVRRMVLLSGRGEEEARVSEWGVRESGAEWTILRSAWMNQNFSEHDLAESVRGGAITIPGGGVAEPFLDAGDIADVAVAALTEDGHAGRIYDLTGPRLLTFAEAADEIGRAGGREVRYRSATPEEFRAELAAVLPLGHADLLAGLFVKVLDGRNAHLTGDVQRVLGRRPRDFADYARETALTGVWSV